MPGHTDRPPFTVQNKEGGSKICMPTVVSYLLSNAFGPKEGGAPGEGQVFNIVSDTWEEPDVEEKEMLLGFTRGNTAAPEISDEERSIRIGRALDANTMRWLGAILYASQA